MKFFRANNGERLGFGKLLNKSGNVVLKVGASGLVVVLMILEPAAVVVLLQVPGFRTDCRSN